MYLAIVCTDVGLWTSGVSWFGRLKTTEWLDQVEKFLRMVKNVVSYVYQEGEPMLESLAYMCIIMPGVV